MERVGATEFVPAAPPPQPAGQAEVMPRVQGFLTAGHLYRGIEHGLSDLASRLGEPVLFVGEPRAQATPESFRWPQLIAVRDLPAAIQLTTKRLAVLERQEIDDLLRRDDGGLVADVLELLVAPAGPLAARHPASMTAVQSVVNNRRTRRRATRRAPLTP